MTSIINQDGVLTPVTLLSAEPNIVTQLKDSETNGYSAVQVGTETAKLTKASTGHFKNSKATPKVVREFRVEEFEEGLVVGSVIDIDAFEVGDEVNVTGTSKGKGWAGTIKRHNFQRGRKTHGGRSYRRPGSIGSMYPQKIFKGKKMSGQMGHDKVTIANLKVSLIDQEIRLSASVAQFPAPEKASLLSRGQNNANTYLYKIRHRLNNRNQAG
jgi:large subunit ribosomal protein L3